MTAWDGVVRYSVGLGVEGWEHGDVRGGRVAQENCFALKGLKVGDDMISRFVYWLFGSSACDAVVIRDSVFGGRLVVGRDGTLIFNSSTAVG